MRVPPENFANLPLQITHYNMPGDNYTVIDYPYKLDDMFYFRLFNNADYLYVSSSALPIYSPSVD